MKTFELTDSELQAYFDAVDLDSQLQESCPTYFPTFAFQAMQRVLKCRRLNGEAEKVTVTFHHPGKIYHLWYSEAKA